VTTVKLAAKLSVVKTQAKPSPVEGDTEARRGMPLRRSIVVLKQTHHG
jgi:hypothetical protein